MADTKSKKQNSTLAITIALIVLNLPLLIFSYANGMVGLKQRSTYMKVVQQCTHQKVLTKECAQEAFPGFGEIVKTELPYIREKQWGGYSNITKPNF